MHCSEEGGDVEGGDGDQDGDPIRLVMRGIEARPRHILRILDWLHTSPAPAAAAPPAGGM